MAGQLAEQGVDPATLTHLSTKHRDQLTRLIREELEEVPLDARVSLDEVPAHIGMYGEGLRTARSYIQGNPWVLLDPVRVKDHSSLTQAFTDPELAASLKQAQEIYLKSRVPGQMVQRGDDPAIVEALSGVRKLLDRKLRDIPRY